MVYLKDKLFIMCLSNAYIEIEIQHGSDIEDAEALSISDAISATGNFRLEVVAGGLDYECQMYLVESFGEVFQVRRNCFPRGIYENCITSIDVWKLDFSSKTREQVKCMDHHVFFLSNSTQLSCLASDLGISKGCVYFTQDEEMSLYKYDLEDDSVLHALPCPNLPAPWCTPKWLMISAAPRLGDSRRTSDHVLEKEEYIHKAISTTENRTVDKDEGIMLNSS
ncbi:hypothetical protein MKW92_008807 [Papaver armeniacum]|nr:hypothetical protein MKW92_008807 [Papaver armeniacum]